VQDEALLAKKVFDMRFAILTGFPESNNANRVHELVHALSGAMNAVHDAALQHFLPVQTEWGPDLLEAVLQISQLAFA
jgi:hypothetical protein